MSGAAAVYSSTVADLVLPDSSARESAFPWGDWEPTDGPERGRNRRAGRVESLPILYPLTRLSAEHELARSLVVVVEADGDTVVMNSPSLRVWGVGSDVYEALSDFGSTLIGIYESYRNTPANELTPDATRYVQLLRSYLER